MRNIKIFILSFALVFMLSTCDDKTNNNDDNNTDNGVTKLSYAEALSSFELNYDTYNVIEMMMLLEFEESSVRVDQEIFIDEDNSFLDMELNVDIGGVVTNEITEGFFEVKDESLLFYYKHPLDSDLYYVKEEEIEDVDFDTDYQYLLDTDKFIEIEDNVYQAEYRFEQVYYALYDELQEFVELLGILSYSDDVYESNIIVTVEVNEKGIELINIDLSELYSELLTYVYTELIGEEYIIEAEAVYEYKMYVKEDVSVLLPSKFVEAEITSNTPLLELNVNNRDTLDFVFDQDNYKFEVSEAGYYQFNCTDDLQIVLTIINVEDPYMFLNENTVFSMIETNSRVLYLDVGVYQISAISNDATDSIKDYSLSVTKKDDFTDDYPFDVYYDETQIVDVTEYTYIPLQNDYNSDIDTVYFPWHEMQDAVVIIPKTVELVDYQNILIYGGMESDDFLYYVVRFSNPDSLQRYMWSLSFFHKEDGLKTIEVKEARSDSNDSKKSLGYLTLENEVIFYAFQEDYIEFYVSEEGMYKFNVETTKDDATFSMDIHEDTDRIYYTGSVSEYNDMTIYLTEGTHVLFPMSNWSDLAIFRLTAEKIE